MQILNEIELDYLDFDLRLERASGGYRAEVLNSPAGTASVTFRMPFSQQELDELMLSLGQGAASVPKLVKDFGWRLFNAVFSGDIQAQLAQSLAEAGQHSTGLRVRLHLSEVPELAELPWEFLYYPPMNDFLALLSKVTIVRYLQEFQPVKPPPLELPVKVLVAISNPKDRTQFDSEMEWNRLNKALAESQQGGLVSLERVDDANFGTLTMKFLWGKYHVFHYIGYGYVDEAAQEGVVLLTDENGQSQRVNSEQIGSMLYGHRSLRLAILQACAGGITSLNDGFESTSQHLLAQNVPAVLAMTYTTSDEATHAIISTIYNAVTGGEWLDRALGEAREQVYFKGHDFEWGSPQLYLGSADGRAFEVATLSPEQRGAMLYREALTALNREDWKQASDKLEKALGLDPTNSDAPKQLEYAHQQAELANLYLKAQTAYSAGDWNTARPLLEQVQAHDPHYKDVAALLAMGQETFQKQQLDKLGQEAEAALKQGDWAGAVPKLEQLLTLDPTQAQTVQEQLNYARQQIELADLYKAGTELYQAQHWEEALAKFRQVKERDGHYQDVENLERGCEEELQRQAMGQLEGESQAAIEREDWETAADRLEKLVQLNPLHFDARDKLQQVREQQEHLKLYNEAVATAQAGHWSEALEKFQELQSKAGQYKDLDQRIAEAQAKLEEQHAAANLDNLYAQAQLAMFSEEWAVAVEILNTILERDPKQTEAQEMLAEARQRQEFATLYLNGYDRYQAGRWRESLKYFYQIRDKTENYKDVNNLIASLEARLDEQTADEDNYLDFDLKLERTGLSYRAEVIQAPVGRAFNNFRLNFSNDELDRVAQNLHRGGPEAAAQVKDFGWRLFNTVFGTDIAHCLNQNLSEAGRRNTGLRIRLHLDVTQAPELSELPWEYLYHPSYNSFVGLLEQVAIVRYREPAQRPRAFPLSLPLRVLAVMSGSNQAEVEQEWASLTEGLDELLQGQLLKLDRLEEVTFSALQRRFEEEEYHILHLTGQGTFDELSGEARLWLADIQDHSLLLTSSELAEAMSQEKSLRMLILQNSRSAPVSRTDPLGELAENLAGQGFPAIVEMPVYGSPEAQKLGLATLYNSLIYGRRVDEALGEVRNTIYNKDFDLEWGAPKLYLSASDGRVFNVEPPTLEQRGRALYLEARAAITRENWPVAITKLEGVVALNSATEDAAQLLTEARRQQELAKLYSAGLRDYQKGNWSEAHDQLGQLYTMQPDYKDVATLLHNIDETVKRQQLSALNAALQDAYARENWGMVVDTLEQVINLDPHANLPELSDKLDQARLQQELATTYATAQEHLKAGRWTEALALLRQLQFVDSNYRDVASLIAQAEVRREQAERQKVIDELVAQTKTAIDQEDWATATAKIGEVAALGPEQTETASQLEQLLQQRQEVAILYINGHEAYKAMRWHDALDTLYKVQSQVSQYRDTDQLITEIEGILQRSQTAEAFAPGNPSQFQVVGQPYQPAPFYAQPPQSQPEAFYQPTQPQAFYQPPAPTQPQTDPFYQPPVQAQPQTAPYQPAQTAPVQQQPPQELLDGLPASFFAPPDLPANSNGYGNSEEPPSQAYNPAYQAQVQPYNGGAANGQPPVYNYPPNGQQPPVYNYPPNGQQPPAYNYPPNGQQPPVYNYPPNGQPVYNYPPNGINQVPPAQNGALQPEKNKAKPPAPPKLKKERSRGEPVPTVVRVIYFIFIGWWFSYFWSGVAYLLALTVVFMPAALKMFNFLPRIVSLAQLEQEPVVPPSNTNLVQTKQVVPQRNVALRILYFIFIGWWAGGIWSLFGWLLCLFISPTLAGLDLLNALPKVMTLHRSADETYGSTTQPLHPQDNQASFWVTVLIILWMLIPIIFIFMIMLSNSNR